MENETNISSATETTNPATAAEDSFLAAFGFGNTSDSTNAHTADEPEADQQTDDKQEEKPAPKDNGTDYPIRYKGKEETLHLTPDQLTAMLQKGRDYDEVRKQRDELSAQSKDYDTLSRMADYFASNNGMSREEYMEYFNSQTSEDGIRAKIDADYPDATDELKAELLESRMAKLAAAKETAHNEEIAADIAALHAEYPDANIDDLPSDVQADITNGLKPVEAMRLHELRELRKSKAELDTQIAALQKEKDNHFRSAGRAESKTSGAAADPFTRGFMGGG